MRFLSLAVLFAAICVLPALAGTYPLGVAAYAGYDVPALQGDIASGSMWGIGVRGNIWRFVHGQLIVRGTSQGDKEEDLKFGNDTETITFKGGTLTGFGLNVLLAKKDPGNVWPYGLLGLSTNSFNFGEESKEDVSKVGWSFGGGLAVNLYGRKFYLDAQTTMLVVPIHDNKASRKNWQSLVGLQYFIPIRMK